MITRVITRIFTNSPYTGGFLFIPDLAVEEVSHVLGPDFYSGFSCSTSKITDFLILYSHVNDKIYESPIMRLIE